jgi:hypothetical protein
MKRKLTSMMLALVFLIGIAGSLFAADANLMNENPNFKIIDNFETTAVSLWWTPDGSGSTKGIVLKNTAGDSITYRAADKTIFNPVTQSTTSMKLAIAWDNEKPYTGPVEHLVRQHMPAGSANIAARQFNLGQALEVFVYGDGSGNRMRFMTRDGIPTLEGSPWISIDWTGWKRIIWDYNLDENVHGWVNGNGVMEGLNFYFDSFQITKDEGGTAQGTVIYFDDFRIVSPFKVDFNIANAAGSEVISIKNITYDGMQTGFVFSPVNYEAGVKTMNLFPGTYQYFVKREGHVSSSGTFTVDDKDIAVNISMQAGNDTQHTVTFTVLDQDGELVPGASISINGAAPQAGVYTFQLAPGFYPYTINKDLYFETTGMLTVVDGNVFVNAILNEIPDVYDHVYLSWSVASTSNNTANRAEKYSVWVAAVSGSQQAFNAEDYVKVFEETLPTNIAAWQYQNRKIEISQFQDKDIRIAFRHHGSTDKDRIAIDNVKLEGVDKVENVTDVFFSENFNGGVPANFNPDEDETVIYDEKWLPAGWLTVDNDKDGLAWYYNIRIIQGGYQAHMLSKSFDNVKGALTPDNWLITPVIDMPMVMYHNITFNVKNAAGAAVTDAIVTLNGIEHPKGTYTFKRTMGSYTYEVKAGEFVPVTGTVVVERENVTIDIVLAMPPVYKVTFIVDMRKASGFVPGETDVYFTGTFPAWELAEPGTHAEQQLTIHNDNVFFYARTLELRAGSYSYLYYAGKTFDNPEWQDATLRTITIAGDRIIEDIFGQVPVSTGENLATGFRMFPNPASSKVELSSSASINSVSIFNAAGQQVYSNRVNNNRYEVNLNNFSNGIYIVRVITTEGVRTHKLQVVK